jgi:hypothetical protein
MVARTARWATDDPDHLAHARELHAHSQEACAERLRELGSPGATQTSVSRWERRKIKPRQANAASIRRYIREAEDEAADANHHDEVVLRLANDDGTFQAAVREITDEPLLGPLQTDFVAAQIERLRTGPAMSQADDVARRDLMAVLRLQ